jgi:Uma2 family endonuclease
MSTAFSSITAAAIAGLPHVMMRLENGDHLTREEFLLRWDACPEIKKAELLDGVVYMPAAVYHSQHSAPHALLMAWLGVYYFATPGIGLGDNGTVSLEEKSLPQPDAFLLLPRELGGQAIENETGYLDGPPAWIGEVAASSASIDLHTKLQLYERAGVPEYLVWRTVNRAIDWFEMRDNRYVPLVADNGILKSGRFPGLWLDPVAMIAGDSQRVYEVLQAGIATAEHAAFKAELARVKR